MSQVVTQVYFDGGCPLCRREIDWYRARVPMTPVEWIDVSAGACDPAGDLCRADAMRVFHVRCSDGELARGALAFALLWQRFPNLRAAGRFAALPGIHHALELAYRVFLRLRQVWR